MRSYSYVRMIVNGKVTEELDIYKEHNVFDIYHYDDNVFSGSYTGAIRYVNEWKNKYTVLKDLLEASGLNVKFEQSIR